MSEIKTTIKQISEYWKINTKISEIDLNFDWCDSDTHCWNCGSNKKNTTGKTSRLERCHIIPKSLGGIDEPKNYVLLCNICHKEAPNTTNPNDMWDWIISNHLPISLYDVYNIQNALIKYKKTEKKSFLKNFKNVNELNKSLNDSIKNISTHGVIFNESTYYYFLKNT
jgi:hypothetical protein